MSHPEPATVGYHLTGRRNRDSITTHGLRPDPVGGYVWIFTDPTTAHAHATDSFGGSQGDNDLWVIDLDGLALLPDPHPGWPGTTSHVIAGHISPHRLTRIPITPTQE